MKVSNRNLLRMTAIGLVAAVVGLTVASVGGGNVLLIAGGAIVLGVLTYIWLRFPIFYFCVGGVCYIWFQELGQRYVVGYWGPVPLNAIQVFVILFTVTMLARIVLDALSTPVGISWLLYVALLLSLDAALFSFVSPSVALGVSAASRMLSCTAALWGGYICARSVRDLRLGVLATEVAGISACVTGLMEYRSAKGTLEAIRRGSVRIGSSLGDPSGAGNVMTIAIPGLWNRVTGGKAFYRLLGAAGFLLVGLGLFTTFTRRAMGLYLLFLVTGIKKATGSTGSRWRRVGTLIGVGIIGGVVIYGGYHLVGQSAVEQRVKDLPVVGRARLSDSSVGSSRGMIWRAVAHGIGNSNMAELLFGHGTASSPFCVLRRAGIFRNAHNSYLEILYDLGITGEVLYLLLVVGIWRALRDVAGRWVGRDGSVTATANSWATYWVLYHMTVEMFGSSVLRIEARWFLMLVAGLILGLKAKDTQNTA